MQLFLTDCNKSKVKKVFLNNKKKVIISVDEIIENFGYSNEFIDDYTSYIISDEIKKQLNLFSKSKKYESIIYSNTKLNYQVASDIIIFAQENENFELCYILTEHGKHEDMYQLFNGIMYYPEVKKIHKIKCESITLNEESKN